jgi:hypothetical protein
MERILYLVIWGEERAVFSGYVSSVVAVVLTLGGS